jgi:hypothetical protein
MAVGGDGVRFLTHGDTYGNKIFSRVGLGKLGWVWVSWLWV